MRRHVTFGTFGGLLIIALLILAGMWTVVQHRRDMAASYEHVMVDGRERQYLLHLPDGYDANETYPLLLALHGGGGSARHFQESRGFDAVADAHGLIVAYPDGVGRFRFRRHTWNSGYLDTYSARQNVDDVSFLHGLLVHLRERYPVNVSRIYMTGHSNGGMMAYRFAAEHPGMLTAVAPVSASIGGKMYEDDPLWVIPEPSETCTVVHLHGYHDMHVPYDGGHGEKSRAYAHLSVNTSIGFWINATGCRTPPIWENSSSGAIRFARYHGGRNDTSVSLVSFTGDGHDWMEMSDTVATEQFYGETLAELVWHMLSM
jgi:polyhydroxybutyrate depolymerase